MCYILISGTLRLHCGCYAIAPAMGEIPYYAYPYRAGAKVCLTRETAMVSTEPLQGKKWVPKI